MTNRLLDTDHAAAADTCVLLSGDPETSTPLAYHIHLRSKRRDGEFIVLDCGTSSNVVEARLNEWFTGEGHSPGDYPVVAGTLLLKDIGRLELRVQRELAKALARRDRRQADRRPRVIASTAESLMGRVREGTFDDTLFYRLNVIHVVLPDRGPSVQQ